MGKVSIAVSGGSGSGSDECTATKAEVLKGYKTITSDSDDEIVEGTLELSGDAADSQVLAGKTYYNTNPKNKRSGTMTNNGAVSQTLNAGASYIIPSGYHNGSGKVTANSLSSQTSASAAVGHILSGQTAWVNGNKITGNIASMEGQTINPSTSPQTVSSSSKYMTGNVVVNPVSNLSSGNIKKGTVVGGVTGTFEGYVAGSLDLYNRGAWGNISVSNLNGTWYSGGNYRVGSIRYDSAQIAIVSGGTYYNLPLLIQKSFNVINYSYLNVTVAKAKSATQKCLIDCGTSYDNNPTIDGLSRGKWRILNSLSNTGYIIISGVNTEQTVSINLTNVNSVVYFLLRFEASGAVYDGDAMYIKRIWFS